MAERARVLGIPELDEELSPSLPPGWIALVIGRAGSPTHLLAKQFIHASAPGVPVRYYTTYERTADVQQVFTDFDWSMDGIEIVNLAQEYYDRVLARELEVSRARERGLRLADLAPSSGLGEGPPRTFNLTSRLIADLAATDGPFRLAIDSVDFLLEVLEGSSVMTLARQIRHRAQSANGQAMLVVQGEIHERSTMGLLQDVADLVVELSLNPTEGGLEHMLMVRKLRNHPERTRIVRTVAGAHGLEVAHGPASRAATDERPR